MTSGLNTVEVCAAVIVDDGRFLLARRPPGKHLAGQWEFPGGKVDDGESMAQCVEREILEELGLAVKAGERLATIAHRYPEKSIRLHFLSCRLLVPRSEFETRLGRPAEVGWFSPPQVPLLDLAPADRRFALRFLSSAKGWRDAARTPVDRWQ